MTKADFVHPISAPVGRYSLPVDPVWLLTGLLSGPLVEAELLLLKGLAPSRQNPADRLPPALAVEIHQLQGRHLDVIGTANGGG